MSRVLLIPTILLLFIGTLCYILSAGALNFTGKHPIIFCTSDDIQTLDVGKMSWMNDIGAATALWEGLTVHDPRTLAMLPGTADSWQISPDALTYTFHIRSSARWSNGDPVRAADFLFAWKRVLTPITGADYIDLFRVIQGASPYTAALANSQPADFSSVGLSAPDDSTFVVHLHQPCAYFLDLCSFPPFFPLHEKSMRPFEVHPGDSLQGYDGAWTHPPHLVTNGPYNLREWKLKEHLLLEPNPFYWDRTHVKCDELILKAIPDSRAALLAYRSGAVDILNFIPEQFGEELLAEHRPDIHYRPVFGSYYFLFNCTRPPFSDKRVRQAFAMAVDREQIVRDVTRMNQLPIGLMVPPNSIPGYTSPPGTPTNIAKAQALLAAAGYPNGQGLRTIEILYNNEKNNPKIAQALGPMWEKNLGVHITYRGLERGSFGAERRDTHDFDIARAGWYGDYTDPTTWLDLARTGDGNNDGLFSSPAYDALLNAAAGETDAPKRFALLSKAEDLLTTEECPFVPLYQYGDGYFFDDHKIKGLDINVRLLTPFKWLRRAEQDEP